LDDQTSWQNTDWTYHARQIIEALNEFPESSKIILVIRHSHRDSSNDVREIAKFRLTPIGHEMSKIFGELLPVNRPLRLFYSRLERCKETAEDILDGFKKGSGKGKLMGSIDALYDLGIIGEKFFKEITKYPYAEFLNRWVASLYPSDVITPFGEYSQKAASMIWKKLEAAPDRCIDVHVSHDLIMLSMRLGWFGLHPGDFWPPFLSGFAFTFNEDGMLLFDFDRFKSIEIPYWWRK